MKKVATITAIAMMAVGAVFASGANEESTGEAKQIVFKLADNSPLSTPLCEANVKFSEYVDEATNGAIKIEVYPDAQLGNENETIEQVKAGVLDLTRVNIIQLVQYVDNYQVFNLPYMFRDDAQRWAVCDGPIGQELSQELFDATSIHNLAYLDSGWRCFYTTKKAVKSVADLKGLKIRVMNSDSNIAMIKAFGAVATPMAYADVFSALQTGVIDGAENDYVSYDTSGHSEVAKNYTVDRHTAGFGVILMSDKAKNKLTAEQYQIVMDCAQRAAEWQRGAMLEQENASKAKVLASGSTINEVNVEEFQNVVQPVYEQYSELKPLIEKIYATK